MKIMVFLHGTTIMHASAVGHTREERVRQVIDNDPDTRDFANYVPVGDAARKLHSWQAQGAEICYLSSHRNASAVELDRAVLHRYGFPEGPIHYRRQDETYAAVASRILPDVLIEDGCESIGGTPEMTYPQLAPQLQAHIHSLVVREFEGIDHLPDYVRDLLNEPVSH